MPKKEQNLIPMECDKVTREQMEHSNRFVEKIIGQWDLGSQKYLSETMCVFVIFMHAFDGLKDIALDGIYQLFCKKPTNKV
jgi:hypothetical protein